MAAGELLAVVGVSVYGRLRTGQGGVGAVGGDTAQGRLCERYAAGEIDDEVYERRLATLRAAGAGPPIALCASTVPSGPTVAE